MNQRYQLLQALCEIHAPSGEEAEMQKYVLDYISKNKSDWHTQPEVIYGDDFQHCILLVFGQPRTAVYAHMDNIGFTVRYGKQLVKVGGPRLETGYRLRGRDAKGEILCKLVVNEEDHSLSYEYEREIKTGTNLSFECDFRESNDFVQSCYLDNRLGVYSALRLCETVEHGVIVFSCWEEHGGGSVPYIAKYLWERFQIRQALISDITWITEGVHHGKGVVVSLRDSGLPRKVFTDRIRKTLTEHNIPHQIEVESSGGSDGNELQKQPYPIDWCFLGAAEENVHTPNELVHKKDIDSMIAAYQVLMNKL